MKRIRKAALLAMILVLLLQAGCAHAKKSDYSAETFYRKEGCASDVSIRIYSTVTYPPTVEIFGMRLDGVEYSYTTIRSDNTIETLTYRQRSDLIHELEQKFRKALPDEQEQAFSEVDLRAFLELEDKMVLLFEGAASLSAASSQQYPCLLVQCDSDLQVRAQVEFVMEEGLNANSLTAYDGGYLCVSPHANFENSVWFDGDLRLLDAPPVDPQDYLLSEEALRWYISDAAQEEIAGLAEDIKTIPVLERVGDRYCCLVQQESVTKSHFYMELDLQGNILFVKHFTGMNIESADLKRYDAGSGAYYDVLH